MTVAIWRFRVTESMALEQLLEHLPEHNGLAFNVFMPAIKHVLLVPTRTYEIRSEEGLPKTLEGADDRYGWEEVSFDRDDEVEIQVHFRSWGREEDPGIPSIGTMDLPIAYGRRFEDFVRESQWKQRFVVTDGKDQITIREVIELRGRVTVLEKALAVMMPKPDGMSIEEFLAALGKLT